MFKFDLNNGFFLMSAILAKNAYDTIIRIKTDISANNIGSTLPVKKDYNYEITASEGPDKCKILVFFGKKGVKTILQGNEHSSLYKRIDSIVFNKSYIPQSEKELEEPAEYIGTDESGKGDIFGPLVIAAVFVDEKSKSRLIKEGVRDSKEIKNGKIQSIAEVIKEIVEDKFVVLSFPPERYNYLYSQFQNLNKLLNYAHSLVIEELLKKVDSPVIITDQFSKTPLAISGNKQFAHKKFIQLPKGEQYTGVAAASILARDEFENWFTIKETEGLFLLKGASKEVDRQAEGILRNYGKESLIKLTKNHFKPVQNLINMK